MKVVVIASVLVVSLLAVAHARAKLPTLRASFPTGDIINGHEAAPGSAPYIVSFKSGSHFCAGSIIDSQWVLTAGHCLVYNSFQIVAGLHNRLNETGAVVRTVTSSQFKVHELYSGGVGPHDIAVVRISPPFVLNNKVSKVNLPKANQTHQGGASLYGWGRVNDGSLPVVLQTVDTLLVEYQACKNALPFGAPVKPTNICSNSNKANEPSISACNGDSGGPLVQNNSNGTELVGIVSWGYVPCGQSNLPSVYTHTSAYIDWIKNNTKV